MAKTNTKAAKKAEPAYKVSIKVMGKLYESSGSTVGEALATLNPNEGEDPHASPNL